MPAATHVRASAPLARRYDDLAAVALIVVLVSAIYGARLARQPIVGEESRWATGAREMLATGDWIVPRQQGQVFPERPPMTMWAMAAVGWVRGEIDAIAVRLPSVTAVVLTSLLIYFYTRALATPFAALVAALVYPTMGQVLQIGRLGESEALFTLFVSAALLLWHVGYARGWPAITTWSIGFACAACGALVKGPQAPIYFVAITGVYLLLRRDWRFLVRWEYAAGIGVFAAIVAAWQVPFYLATDWQTVAATWSGLAADRIHLSGILKHLATYPLETFACLLPWSPILVALVKRDTRELLADCRPLVGYLVVAIAVAYPTVWLATGARGRYFMPLYPLVAVLIALVIERCSAGATGHYPRRAWHQFMLLCGGLSAAIAVAFVGFGLTGALDSLHQPLWQNMLLAAVAGCVCYVLASSYRHPRRVAPMLVVIAVAVFAGVLYTGAIINRNSARWNDPTSSIAGIRGTLPVGTRLVSLAPIEHRFAYYYNEPIEELAWPRELADLPSDVEWFCFMRTPGDTASRRAAGRGRTWTTTPGTLPFAWVEEASINAERSPRDERRVVIGRVVRPLRAEVIDATQPRVATASASDRERKR